MDFAMQSEQSLKHLLSVIRSRHIGLTDEDIRLIFNTSREDATAWVNQCLGKETLLSFEEAQLYSKLKKQDFPVKLSKNLGLSAVQPLLDGDFETSIKLLESSTSVIEEQTRTLQLQEQTFIDFQKTNDQERIRSERATEFRRRQLYQQKQNTTLAVDELIQSLSEDLAVAQQALQTIRNNSRTTIFNSLKHDDNKLSEINRLANSLRTSDDEERHQIFNIESLCARLKAYMTNGIRCHLDQVYLKVIQSLPVTEALRSSEITDLERSLETELGTLYTEIDDVAQMSINHEFFKPLNDLIEKQGDYREAHVQIVLNNIDADMKYLQEKMLDTLLQLQAHHSHFRALNLIANELSKLRLGESNVSFNSSKIASSQVYDHGVLHEKSLQNDLHSNQFTENDDNAAEQNQAEPSHRELLQILGCPLPNNSDLNGIQDFLDSVAYTRAKDNRMRLAESNRAMLSSLNLNLDAASICNDIMIDGLFKDTKWHEFEPVESQLKSRIAELDAEIGKVGSAMENLDLEKLQVVSAEAQNFVNNWSD